MAKRLLFDADNHYYEADDALTRYLPESKRHLGPRFDRDENGVAIRAYLGDEPFTFLGQPFERDRVGVPGSLREMLRAMKSGDTIQESAVSMPLDPAFLERDARIKLMDQQGLDAAFLFPAIGVCIEHSMKDDPEQTYVLLRAFNDWLDDDWGYAYLNRIYAVPLLSLLDLERAIDELERVLDRGTKMIHLLPGPQGDKSPGDPYFDPFWARVNEAGVGIACHIGESGYNERFSTAFGEEANPTSHHQSAFQWACSYGDRPIMDTVASLIFLNFFGRFPNINLMSVENGSLWVGYLMDVMDKMKGMGRNGPWPGGYVAGKPSEVLKRHVFVAPYHEENIPALVDRIGDTQVLFGSDYPHPEGLAEPATFVEGLAGLPEASIDLIMGQNAARLVGR